MPRLRHPLKLVAITAGQWVHALADCSSLPGYDDLIECAADLSGTDHGLIFREMTERAALRHSLCEFASHATASEPLFQTLVACAARAQTRDEDETARLRTVCAAHSNWWMPLVVSSSRIAMDTKPAIDWMLQWFAESASREAFPEITAGEWLTLLIRADALSPIDRHLEEPTIRSFAVLLAQRWRENLLQQIGGVVTHLEPATMKPLAQLVRSLHAAIYQDGVPRPERRKREPREEESTESQGHAPIPQIPTNGQGHHHIAAFFKAAGAALLQKQWQLAHRAFSQAWQLLIHEAGERFGDDEKVREHHVTLNSLGRSHATGQRFEAAREVFAEACRVAEAARDASSDPTAWKSRLSISLAELGDTFIALGDPGSAREAYERDLALTEARANAAPDDTAAQRELSVSLGNLGEACLALNDHASASRLLQRAHSIRLALQQSEPNDFSRLRDLLVSHTRLGSLAFATGDPAHGRDEFRAARKIAEKLCAADPTNSEWLADKRAVDAVLAELGE